MLVIQILFVFLQLLYLNYGAKINIMFVLCK